MCFGFSHPLFTFSWCQHVVPPCNERCKFSTPHRIAQHSKYSESPRGHNQFCEQATRFAQPMNFAFSRAKLIGEHHFGRGNVYFPKSQGGAFFPASELDLHAGVVKRRLYMAFWPKINDEINKTKIFDQILFGVSQPPPPPGIGLRGCTCHWDLTRRVG